MIFYFFIGIFGLVINKLFFYKMLEPSFFSGIFDGYLLLFNLFSYIFLKDFSLIFNQNITLSYTLGFLLGVYFIRVVIKKWLKKGVLSK